MMLVTKASCQFVLSPISATKIESLTLFSWYYPWLKWTFSDLPEDEYNDNVSFCMDMFGYSYYISLLISPLPGFLIEIIKKCSSGPKGIRVYIGLRQPDSGLFVQKIVDRVWTAVVKNVQRFHL